MQANNLQGNDDSDVIHGDGDSRQAVKQHLAHQVGLHILRLNQHQHQQTSPTTCLLCCLSITVPCSANTVARTDCTVDLFHLLVVCMVSRYKGCSLPFSICRHFDQGSRAFRVRWLQQLPNCVCWTLSILTCTRISWQDWTPPWSRWAACQPGLQLLPGY